MSSVLTVKNNFVCQLVQSVRSFKPYQNEHNSVKSPGEKGKKPCSIDLKISMKILFHVTHLPFLSSNPKILKAFLKTFATKMKPTKCPARGKKWGKKSEKRGEERKRKVKVKTSVSLFNPKLSRNFAFCVCLNFASWYFAPGLEGRKVQDL